MKKIVLISCGSSKLNKKAQAQHLYTGNVFRMTLQYAKALNPDEIFIVSAKYGLVELTTELEPYDLTLKICTNNYVRSWAKMVIQSLSEKTDLKTDHFIILTGNMYYKYLIGKMLNYEIPFAHLKIGERLQFMNKRLKK